MRKFLLFAAALLCGATMLFAQGIIVVEIAECHLTTQTGNFLDKVQVNTEWSWANKNAYRANFIPEEGAVYYIYDSYLQSWDSGKGEYVSFDPGDKTLVPGKYRAMLWLRIDGENAETYQFTKNVEEMKIYVDEELWEMHTPPTVASTYSYAIAQREFVLDREIIDTCTYTTATGNFEDLLEWNELWNEDKKQALMAQISTEAGVAYHSNSNNIFLSLWDDTESKYKQVLNDNYLVEGQYRFNMQVRIDGDDAKAYRFPNHKEDMYVMVDGKRWEMKDDPQNTSSYCNAYAEYELFITPHKMITKNDLLFDVNIEEGNAMLMPNYDDISGKSYYTGNIHIPDSVAYKGINYPMTRLYEGAFADAEGILSIHCDAKEVPEIINASAFGDLDISKIDLYVPAASRPAYKADPIWGKFKLGDTRDVITTCTLNSSIVGHFTDQFHYGDVWNEAKSSSAIASFIPEENASYRVSGVAMQVWDKELSDYKDVALNKTLKAGSYRFLFTLTIDGDNGILYRFVDNAPSMTITVSGEECTVLSNPTIAEESSYVEAFATFVLVAPTEITSIEAHGFAGQTLFGQVWNDDAREAAVIGLSQDMGDNHCSIATWYSEMLQWNPATESMEFMANDELIVEGRHQFAMHIYITDPAYIFPAEASKISIIIDDQQWYVTQIDPSYDHIAVVSPEFEIYPDQEAENGIIYSFTLSDHKAMVMPATAFEEATGNERYEGVIEIPAKVTHKGIEYDVNAIYGCAFADCPNLTSVTLPASIELILESIFAESSNLTTFICNAVVVPVASANAFDGMPEDLVPQVPAESLEAYKADAVWGKFWDKKTGLESLSTTPKSTKMLREGKVVIVREGKTYTIIGQEVK